ncbi:GNAT family N-acetyltransferase [Dyadobacter aurulentus]|uniref:GNAT family N-acetyltransferase n=1 Tax=Dyadobacter sp. UC 10 TaxID=2605428 RepID=UPI0011F18A0E|nr:GNAT family N-acetyltransferase [Dyadobacter sp. UC 10]KAA0990088.1 GNAT family N-acetyltransferase [Dyadobacter sp. UC 10]
MIGIIRTNSDNPDFKKLTDKLDDELCLIYNTKKEDFEEYNRIVDLDTVVLAYEDKKVTGCGCFKTLNDATIELKRMYVEPEFRGRGIASALVAEIEKWAMEKGYHSAFLETGNGQPQAIALYRKLGYSQVTDLMQYAVSDYSVCLQKELKIKTA